MLHMATTKGLTGTNLFKIIFTGYLFSLGPLILIMGFLSIFGITTITLGNSNLTGIEGFLGSILLAFLFPVIFAGINWLFIAFGLWLFTRFRNLKIIYKSATDNEDKIIHDD